MKAEHLEIRDLKQYNQALQDKLSESQKEIFTLKVNCEKLQAKLNHLEYLRDEKNTAKTMQKLSDENERLSQTNKELNKMINRFKHAVQLHEDIFRDLAARGYKLPKYQTPGTQV